MSIRVDSSYFLVVEYFVGYYYYFYFQEEFMFGFY